MVHHLLMAFPLNKLIWQRSPWQLKFSYYHTQSVEEWIENILGQGNQLPLQEQDRNNLAQFMAVMMERIWMERNHRRLGKPPTDWLELSTMINLAHIGYVTRSERRIGKRIPNHRRHDDLRWVPPR